MSLLLTNLLNTAYSYISPSPSTQPSPISRQPSALSSPLAERLHAACHSPTSSIAHLDPTSMRRELDNAKHDLARANADASRFEERCKMLEKTLKETRELLRTREAELEKLRRERDRERAMAERRRSDVGPQYQPQQLPSIPYSRSLDTRMSAGELSRQMHANRAAQDAQRAMSPSRYSLSSASASSVSLSSDSLGPINNIATITEEDRARMRSAETYMTRTDSWSGAQVLQAIHDLNQEILQFAAAATETCTFSPPASSNPRLAQLVQDTSTRIGPNITRILADRDHSQDPLLVQLALQGCVSLCVARALNSFCIGFPTKSDAVLSQIYTHIHTTEPQPTSAKWRALTHSHIHAIYPTLTDYSVSELSDTILRWCTDIFAVAHCRSFGPTPSTATTASSTPSSRANPPTTSPSIPTSTPSDNPAMQLRTRYLDQIRRISRAVLRLASVTREDIMSTSFEIVIADPSGTFVEGEMVDAFGDYSESDGAILVTMELGLKCITRVSPLPNEVGQAGVVNGGSTNGLNGVNGTGLGKECKGVEEGILETRMLLQPKVVLESVLEVLDN